LRDLRNAHGCLARRILCRPIFRYVENCSMKRLSPARSLALSTWVFVLAAPAMALAANVNTVDTLTQSEFRSLSEDLGAALSYKPMIPSEPLGITGFDIGVAVTGTRLKNASVLSKASGNDSVSSTLYVPSLRAHKGLPFDIDIGVNYTAVPSTNLKLYGGELRWAVLAGSTVSPAVAVRVAINKVNGVDQLAFDTTSLDLSVSKGVLNLTPYAGVGQVWVKSTPKGSAASFLSAEKFTQTKVYAGVNVNLGLNLDFEVDSTGGITSYGVKAGVRF